MLKEITLHNFKSWQHVDKMRLAPITGLFGSNSSGKTSILQWLLMLKQTAESADRRQVLNLGDERSLVELGTFQDILFGHDTDTRLSWSVSWSPSQNLTVADPAKKGGAPLFRGTDIGHRCEVYQEEGGPVRVGRLAYEFGRHQFQYAQAEEGYDLSYHGRSVFHFKRFPGRPWPLPDPVKCYGFPDQVNTYFQNAGFLGVFQLAFEQLLGEVHYLGPLREYPKRQYIWSGGQPTDMGRRGEKVIDALLSSRLRPEKISRGKGRPKLTLEEYVAQWLRDLGLIHDFNVKPVAKNSNLYQVLVRKTKDSAPVLVTDVGFGVSQVLPVLTLCYYVPPHSTIILEQPEIHLHPSVQAGLADVFIDAVKTRNIQVLVESHSEHLLRRLQRGIAEEKMKAEDTALYFCDTADGRSELVPLNMDPVGNISNWPKDFFGDEFGEIAAMAEAAAKRRLGGQ